jgi:protein tyrosine/serine phosphatase
MTARPLEWTENGMGFSLWQTRPVRWLAGAVAAVSVSLLFGAAGLAVYCGAIIHDGNFQAVQEHVLYRSAQLGKGELESFARQYGLKSVLNLRGAHPGTYWYDQEMAATHDLGLGHYDYPLSAKRFVTGREIADILAIVRDAPKPLLIHCQSGADRSGLVAALFRYALAGAGAAEAGRQLSLVYGHFPYLTSRSGAMDDSFWAYVAASQEGAAH